MKLTPGALAFWREVGEAMQEVTECQVHSEEDLAAYFEQRLKPAETRALELHLEVCSVCREMLQTLEELRRNAPELFPSPRPQDVLDVIWQAPGPVTAREIRAFLNEKGHEAGSRHVSAALRKLTAQGLIEADVASRPRVYRPLQAQGEPVEPVLEGEEDVP